jgi:hypothetical protein
MTGVRRSTAIGMTSGCHLAGRSIAVSRRHAVVPYRHHVATPQYRTLLDKLVRHSRRTVDETCAAFERKARDMREAATLSPRQLARWMSGDVGQPRPVAQRVAEELWGYKFEVLLGPPDAVRDQERPDEPVIRGLLIDVDTLEAAALMAAHESSEHAATASGAVSSTDIEGVQEAVWRLARQYHRESPLQLLAKARHVRNIAYLLLDRTRRPAQTTDLYLVAGQACGLLAVASFDLAMWDAAEEQARSAHTYADTIGHAGLRAWARGTQALIANWMGRPRRAVELISLGVPEAPSGAATARLRGIEARAWAELGKPDRVEETLRLGDAEIESANHDDLHDGIGGEFGWGPSRHAACAGTALLSVGDADGAVERIQQALTLLPRDPFGGLVSERAQIDLAAAELVAGRLDASIAALDDVWALPAPQRRQGLTGRLDQLARHLTAAEWRDASEAGELRDRIEAFNAEATMVRALPAS